MSMRDEVMRSALELTAMKNLPVEDAKRASWAEYHVKKGREYAKTFMGEEARYEYQRALKLNPYDTAARSEYAELLTDMEYAAFFAGAKCMWSFMTGKE